MPPCLSCGKPGQYKYSQDPADGGRAACKQACRDALGIEGPLRIHPSQLCSGGCGKVAQARVQDAEKNRYCSKACLPEGVARVVSESVQCTAVGCTKPAHSSVQDAEKNRYCSKACLPKGVARVTPVAAQCTAVGCTKPSSSLVQDAEKNRYCSRACLPKGVALMVPDAALCAAVGCGKPAQSVVQDAEKNRYCSKACLPKGVALVVPESLQCAAVGCTTAAQSSVLDAEKKSYCSAGCLPAGVARVTPSWALCAAAGCDKPAGWIVQDAQKNCYCSLGCLPKGVTRMVPESGQCAAADCCKPAWCVQDAAQNRYCSLACLPEEERARRIQVAYDSYGEPRREVAMPDALRSAYAARILPLLREALANRSTVFVFGTSICLASSPAEVYAKACEEAGLIMGRDSAVLVKHSGSRWDMAELLAKGATVRVVAASRILSATGASGLENEIQEALGGDYERGMLGWTSTSGNGPPMKPDRALLCCVMVLPASIREASIVTASPEQTRYDAKNALLTAAWKLREPNLDAAAASIAAYEASNPGRTLFINPDQRPTEVMWPQYLKLEKDYHSSVGSLVPTPPPPPNTWNGILALARVRPTGWNFDDVPGLSSLMSAAGAIAVPKGKSGDYTLLVFTDHYKQHGKIAAAVRANLAICSRDVFLTSLRASGGPSAGGAGSAAAEAAPPRNSVAAASSGAAACPPAGGGSRKRSGSAAAEQPAAKRQGTMMSFLQPSAPPGVSE